MSYLFDSNCFLRLADKNCVERQIVLKAIQKLRQQNDAIYYTPQVLAEFWNVCTRPNSVRGGFGFSISQTAKKVSLIQKYFGLLPDNLSTFQEWQKLVIDFSVIGVQVHDTKIVASMTAHKVQNLVTFNEKDFKRFPMIKVLNPNNI